MMMRPRRMVLCVLVVATVLVACTPAPRFAHVAPGEPGAAGPCGSVRTDRWNPMDERYALVVFEPTGAAAPNTGGRCDDDERPVVLFAHGYIATAAEVYQGLIDHLVGNGYVVVFQGYTTDYAPEHQYGVVDSGFALGVETSGRVDVDRVGVIGHSFGGGMTPWLLQQVTARGWGTEALWAVLFAPWFAQLVGDAAITLAPHARVTVVAYEEDVFVDARIGIEMFLAFDLPDPQKTHVTLFTDRSHEPTLFADHFGPISTELLPTLGVMSTDHHDEWSAWRAVDATAGCALDGRWCDTDLTDTGDWPDGTPVTPAIVSDDPQDIGPPALQECEFFMNQRRCPA